VVPHFGGAVAAVAGALTGLLFVALSVKGTALSGSRALSSLSAETLVLFMTSVMIGVVIVAPQPVTAVGAELLALAAVAGAVLFVLDRRAGHAREPGVTRFVERFSPNTITAVLVARRRGRRPRPAVRGPSRPRPEPAGRPQRDSRRDSSRWPGRRAGSVTRDALLARGRA